MHDKLTDHKPNYMLVSDEDRFYFTCICIWLYVYLCT